MSPQTTLRPRLERDRPALRRERRPSPSGLPTLVSRRETSRILGGLSTTTLMRMEEAGRLVPIKPSGFENGKTFYALAQVMALAEGSEPRKSEN